MRRPLRSLLSLGSVPLITRFTSDGVILVFSPIARISILLFFWGSANGSISDFAVRTAGFSSNTDKLIFGELSMTDPSCFGFFTLIQTTYGSVYFDVVA